MSKTKKNKAYVTKRIVVRNSTRAIRIASEKAMDIAGSTVIVLDGWVVRKYEDGRIKKIEKLDSTINHEELSLD
jgi:hypothetical protein